jgi:hypothetical protein
MICCVCIAAFLEQTYHVRESVIRHDSMPDLTVNSLFGVAHVRICLEVEGRFQPGCLSMICVHLFAATGCCFQILVLYLKFWFFFY